MTSLTSSDGTPLATRTRVLDALLEEHDEKARALVLVGGHVS